MKEGNEEARQTEGDNGQGDRGWKTRRARAKLADREGRAVRGTANGRRKGEWRKERGWTVGAGEGIEGCTRRKRAEGRKGDRRTGKEKEKERERGTLGYSCAERRRRGKRARGGGERGGRGGEGG